MESNSVKIAGYVVQGLAVLCLGFLVYSGKASVEVLLAALSGAGLGLFRPAPGSNPNVQ